mmetsp:Transcript_54277/g.176408  ORF Transcript_54277/g.176408 Transcript_54277/m.176408 type:complete len:299 (-) Transcript_54277:875-1771(-)
MWSSLQLFGRSTLLDEGLPLLGKGLVSAQRPRHELEEVANVREAMNLLEGELDAPLRVDAAGLQRVRVGHASDGQIRLHLLDALHLHVVVRLLHNAWERLAHLLARLREQCQLSSLVARVHVRDAHLQHGHASAHHAPSQGDLHQVISHEEDGFVLDDIEVIPDALPRLLLALLQALGLDAQRLADGLHPCPCTIRADRKRRVDQLALLPAHERGCRTREERVDSHDVDALADSGQICVPGGRQPTGDSDALALELQLELLRDAVRKGAENDQRRVRLRVCGQGCWQIRTLGSHGGEH